MAAPVLLVLLGGLIISQTLFGSALERLNLQTTLGAAANPVTGDIGAGATAGGLSPTALAADNVLKAAGAKTGG